MVQALDKEIEEMGMTNSQFKVIMRLLRNDVKDVIEEKDEEEKNKKLSEILDTLQAALED